MVVFHKCLIDFFDKVPSTHIGNTILVDHNPIRTMKTPIENVVLVEKWNHRVKIFSKYPMGEVLPYLETLHSTSKSMFTLCSVNLLVRCNISLGQILNFDDFYILMANIVILLPVTWCQTTIYN
jgi:hypothetical protein